MAKTFKRGLKIPIASESKKLAEEKAVENVPPVKQVVIPVNQHIGAPNQVLAAVGDAVKRGQIIADNANPGLTLPVHASISGTVKKIEPRLQSNNVDGMCIVIEADGESGDAFMPILDPFSCSKDEALKRIRDAGVAGMGGAGFPTYVKLNPPQGKTIDYIIVNGAECEPYLTTDYRLMLERADELVRGTAIVMKITGVKRGMIGVEKEKLIPVLEEAIKKAQDSYFKGMGEISADLCLVRYPQGGEKMLITALTGREVPTGGLPMDAGCIVQNVGTLVAVAEAFDKGKPLIERELTVTGRGCKTPKNIRAPIGMLLSDLPKEFMDIDFDNTKKILYGGPMMGSAVTTTAIPIQKNTSGILFLTAQETFFDLEGPCIRCSRCMYNCPCRLSPAMMKDHIVAGDLDLSVKMGLWDCIECGVCAYVCPGRLKLVQHFRIGKARLRAK